MPKGIHGSWSVCSVEGCERRMLAREFCSMHWQRWKRSGEVGEPSSRVRIYETGEICMVDGCTSRPRSRGMCGTHWIRWKKYGDPTVTLQAPNGAGHITPYGYRMLKKTGHPLAGKNGFVFEHRAVLFAALGPGEHPCHWCKRLVSWSRSWPQEADALVVDHLDWDRLNNGRANLVPSCNPCNHARQKGGR
jgi:hypothetical protein